MKISTTAESFSSPYHGIRASSIKPVHLFLVVIVAFLLFATTLGSSLAGLIGLSGTKAPTNGTCPTGYTLVNGTCVQNGQTTSQGLNCIGSTGPSSNSLTLASNLPVRQTILPYGSASISSLVDNRFTLQAGTNGIPSYVQISDTGASSSGTAATGSQGFDPANGWLEEFGATGGSSDYQEWVQVSSSMFGQTNNLPDGASYALNCYSPGAGQFDWNGVTTILNVPASAATATSGMDLVVLSSTGSTAALPTSATRYDIESQIATTYSAADVPTTVYGTLSAPVINYGSLTAPTGGVVTTSGPVQLGAYVVIFGNITGITVQLDAAAAQLEPQAQLVYVNTGLNTAATREWIVGPLKGCSPSGGGSSSTNLYTCDDMPIDVTETGATLSHHADLAFFLRDNTQGGWLVQNAYETAAVTAFPAAGSASTVTTNFNVLIPVTGNNAGNQATLIKQQFGIIATD